MVHGPLDVKTKPPTVPHQRRFPLADPPSQMLFIARGTRLTLREEEPIACVEVHAPTSFFFRFFS
jgi:hypothetical protein